MNIHPAAIGSGKSHSLRLCFAFLAIFSVSACSSNPAPRTPAPVTTTPAPVPTAVRPSGLPPIAAIDGPLAVDVVYPREGSVVNVRDSTFIFGNVGSGRAELRINGATVPVEANGAFIAFLPVPSDGVYRVEATRDGQSARAERRIRVPGPDAAVPSGAAPRAVILASSIAPRGSIAVQRGEPIDIVFRGTPGGRATLLLPSGRRVPLLEQPGTTTSTYRATIPAEPFISRDTAVRRPRIGSTEIEREIAVATAVATRGDSTRTSVAPLADETSALFELIVGSDTVRTPLPATVAVIDPLRPTIAVAADPNPVGGDNDGYIVGRPAPGTVSHYFWPNGTEFNVVAERAGEYRVQLSDELSAWVSAAELRLQPSATTAPTSLVNNVSLAVDTGWVDVRFPVSRRLPFVVDEKERELVVTLYGATAASDWLLFGARDPMVEHAWWEQPRDGEFRFTIRLNKPVWGYTTSWDERGRLVLRVRRPPPLDAGSPLRGRLITIDPGHGPPEGRWGPTRLTEAQANLSISHRLRMLVEQAGGRVQMTRIDSSAVGLYDRPAMATRANADAFVSVHNNAVGDGTNPFTNHGTSTYFFHANSLDLAREMQNELVKEFQLPDLGYVRASLAVVRWPTWMPAVLTETMFFIMPEQEAALRNPEVIDRIARAHFRALETFFRNRAGR